jgi:hypothetical protein
MTVNPVEDALSGQTPAAILTANKVSSALLAYRWHERRAQAVAECEVILLLDEQQVDLQRACRWVATAQSQAGACSPQAG